MRTVIPLLMILVAGCNTPGPDFRGIPAHRMTIGPSMFDIRVTGRRAQALHLTPEWLARFEPIAIRAVLAIEQISGCRVHRLTGDVAVMQASLDCGNGPPSDPLIFPDLDCDLYLSEDGYGDASCHPY